MFTSAPWTLIGTVALGLAVLTAVYVVWLLSILVLSRRWISVPAQLVKVDIKHRKLEDRTLRGEKLIREIPLSIHVEYVYESAGKQLRGRALNLMDLVAWGFGVDRRDIEEVRGMGERIGVWTDPKRPARAVVFRRIPINALVAPALLLCLSVTAAAVTVAVIVDTVGSIAGTAIVAVGAAAILHAIARGIAYLVGRRS